MADARALFVAADGYPEIDGRATLSKARDAARGCTACDLHARATQTVFGEGSRDSRVMLIGEQPGDREDVTGKPFVGPAGGILDRALEEAGIDRSTVFVTNVVKHFKWKPRGKRRLHEKPNAVEIAACRHWLDLELQLVKPEVVVCLGSTAAQALLGKQFRVTRDRGVWVESDIAPNVIATIHPSAILRADDDTREQELERFIADLRKVAKRIAELEPVDA